MARLPDYTALGQTPTPTSERPTGGYRAGVAAAGDAAVGEAVAGLGTSVTKVGGEIQDAQDRLTYASGVQDFLAKNLDIRQRAATDPDYATAPTRYGGEIQQAVADSASRLSSPALRAEFTTAMARYASATQDEIATGSRAKAKDADLGWLKGFIDNSTDQALKTPDDAQRAELVAGMTTAVNAMRDKGSLSASEAATMRDAVGRNYAKQLWTMKAEADPAAALRELQPDSVAGDGTPVFKKTGTTLDYLAPADRMALVAHLKPLATELQAQAAGDRYLGRGAPAAQVQAIPVSSDQLVSAIATQESGGNAAAPASVDGAVGKFQITPATFQQYARPGESIANPADNAAVGKRIIADLSDRYGGDPARVAVAYFSGPGNVAPAGYETPWIRDTADGNGQTTSGYVTQVMNRLGRGDVLHSKAATLAQIDQDYRDNPQLGDKVRRYVTEQYSIANTEALAAEKDRRDRIEAATDGYVKKILPANLDANGAAQLKNQIIADPSLDAQKRTQLVGMLESSMQTDVGHDTKTYGPGFYDLYQRVHLAPGDPSRITDPTQLYPLAQPGGPLTVAGVDKLSAEIAAKRTPDGEAEAEMKKTFLANAKSQISGANDALHLKDPKGEEGFLKFLAAALPAYDAGRKEGKTAVDLLNPDSKDYVGKSLPQFVRTPQQKMQDMMSANTPAADTGAPDLSTAQGIVAAYRARKLTKEAAEAEAIKRGFIKPAAGPQVPLR